MFSVNQGLSYRYTKEKSRKNRQSHLTIAKLDADILTKNESRLPPRTLKQFKQSTKYYQQLHAPAIEEQQIDPINFLEFYVPKPSIRKLAQSLSPNDSSPKTKNLILPPLDHRHESDQFIEDIIHAIDSTSFGRK